MTVEHDGLRILGPCSWTSVVFDTHHDHRMAMALSLLSLCVTGVEVADPEVVTKSWPNYFAEMTAILGSNEMGN